MNKKDAKKRKRTLESPNTTSCTSTSSDSEEEEHKQRKRLKKNKKKSKKKKQKKEKLKKRKNELKIESEELIGPEIPRPSKVEDDIDNQETNKRRVAPMTKEEWEKKQSIVRRVYDAETGRNRLVKGDGEIIEEIVSYSRHKEINKQATKGDGNAFSQRMGLNRIK